MPTTASKKRLGRRIAQARIEAGLTAAELGARIGKSQGTIYSWESGRYAPRHEDLLKLAEALGRDPAWFYGEDEEPDIEQVLERTQRELEELRRALLEEGAKPVQTESFEVPLLDPDIDLTGLSPREAARIASRRVTITTITGGRDMQDCVAVPASAVRHTPCTRGYIVVHLQAEARPGALVVIQLADGQKVLAEYQGTRDDLIQVRFPDGLTAAVEGSVAGVVEAIVPEQP